MTKILIDNDLDLAISNTETKDLIIPFKKISETNCPPTKLSFYNTATKKNEDIAFYNYYEHQKKKKKKKKNWF